MDAQHGRLHHQLRWFPALYRLQLGRRRGGPGRQPPLLSQERSGRADQDEGRMGLCHPAGRLRRGRGCQCSYLRGNIDEGREDGVIHVFFDERYLFDFVMIAAYSCFVYLFYIYIHGAKTSALMVSRIHPFYILQSLALILHLCHRAIARRGLHLLFWSYPSVLLTLSHHPSSSRGQLGIGSLPAALSYKYFGLSAPDLVQTCISDGRARRFVKYEQKKSDRLWASHYPRG